MTSRRFLLWGALVVLLLVGVGLVSFLAGREAGDRGGDTEERDRGGDRDREATTVPVSPEGAQLAGVKTAPAEVGSIAEVVRVIGTIEPDRNRLVQVGPLVSGRASQLLANVGEAVAAGQVLGYVESGEVAQAQAAYTAARGAVQAARARRAAASAAASFAGAQLQRTRQTAAAGGYQAAPLEAARNEAAAARSALVTARSAAALAQANLMRAQRLYAAQIIARKELQAARAAAQQAQADLQGAQARAGTAQEALRREQTLSQQHVRVATALQTAETNLHAARQDRRARAADLLEAEGQLQAAAQTLALLRARPGSGRARIPLRAPISGRIIARPVGPGQPVTADSTLFTLLDLRTVWAQFQVYPTDLPKVRPGATVQITSAASPSRVYTGRVRYVGEVVDPQAKTIPVRVELANPGGMLKAGLAITGRIATGRRLSAVLVPEHAVVNEGERPAVYVFNGKEYEKREVTVGLSVGGRTEIISGVKPGEQVVVQGQHELQSAGGAGALQADTD